MRRIDSDAAQTGDEDMFATAYTPPEARRAFAAGGTELRLTEAAVMLAFAEHLFAHPGAARSVTVHPDGEHAKVFDIIACLSALGFQKSEALGTTSYGGRYQRGEDTLIVHPRSGLGDVVGAIDGQAVIAECKGGVVNSTHPGQKSRLRRGLAELIGQLMLLPVDGARHIAVLPRTSDTARMAARLHPRCRLAGIEIALVREDGAIRFVDAASPGA